MIMRKASRTNDRLKDVIAIACTLAFIAGLVYACTYRKSETVQVNSRYWTWDAAVKYDTQEISTECETVRNCTGSGDERVCTEELVCEQVTHTTTHTRCRNASTGVDLPPRQPELCAMYVGDYISGSPVYHIAYRVVESDKTGEATFDSEKWSELEPGALVRITTNVLDRITKVEKRRN